MSKVVIGGVDQRRAASLAGVVRSIGLVCVETAPSPERAAAAGFDPDTSVVVLDGAPTAPVLGTVADATAARPELAVLVIGPATHAVDALVALASGARGYLPTGSVDDAVAGAVRDLLDGDVVLPRFVALSLVQHLRWGGRGIVMMRDGGPPVELTNREWEVLVLLRQGRSTTDIARRLVVSAGTVRSHVAAVVHKLGVTDRAALAANSGCPPCQR